MTARGFAFDWEDMVLTSIREDDEDVDHARVDREERESAVAKTETARLASLAKKEIDDLQDLLEKLKTGTATRAERERMHSFHAKLDRLKEEMDKSKTRESEAEKKMLLSKSTLKASAVHKAIKEKEIRSVIRAVCAAESVDLAFLVDCTGSMAGYIAAVKDNIRKVVQKIKATNGNLSLRLAVVGYRDIDDGSSRFEVLDFVDDVKDFETFVGSLSAKGGGDTPEDIAGAIQQANRLTWNNSTRVAFIVGDAPCHGRRYHDFEDSYPDGTPGIDIVRELREMQSNSGSGTMSVYFGRITPCTDDMIVHFKNDGILMKVVNVNEMGKFADCITKSVRTSIFKTLTVTGAAMKSVAFAPSLDVETLMKDGSNLRSRSTASLKDYHVIPTVPSFDEWTTKPAVAVKVYRNESIRSIDDLKAPIGYGILKISRARTDRSNKSTMFMRRAKEPFAEGEIRIAFFGQLAHRPSDLNLSKSMMVMKMFKHVGKGVNDCKQYLKQMEVSTIAHFMASEYNKSSSRPAHCARVEILQVFVVEEEEDVNETAGNRRFCVESPLPGDGAGFTKFSNNIGYWNGDHLDETLLRFTEYTFVASDGYLMVTDLQGVRSGDTFYLTDPVILCKDILRFGHTNLGEKFMQKCIDSTRAYKNEKGWL